MVQNNAQRLTSYKRLEEGGGFGLRFLHERKSTL